MKIRVFDLVAENWSYKLVALLIALILWVTILGRRDLQVQKSFQVDFRATAQMSVASSSGDRVLVRISGPRSSVKKYLESSSQSILVLDVPGLVEGPQRVVVPLQKIELPLGLKLLDLSPTEFEVRLQRKL